MRSDRSPRGRGAASHAAALLVAALATPAQADGPADYARDVKPLLKARCYACHGSLKRKASLRLDTAAAMLRGGDGGPAVVPGHSEESPLIDRVSESDPTFRMPPEGAPLTEAQVAQLRAWIDAGAESPADESPEPDPREHWSFVPPVRPDLPPVRDTAWGRNPIDAFLAVEHERRGLPPVPEAEPHVLLRRLYLDLVGLPPTREELRAFLADPSEAAYERVVDRLLASPQYGERWARHWMDVWRYSDWYGRRAVPDVLNSYAMIWRWRDWIVRSLNEDRPYSRMVRAMLAADEADPTDRSEVVATGYLVRNWYRWNYNLWMKDNVEHTAKAFLGLTINCAHCHDHKYDPITHEDYFAFRAFFEPLEIRHDRVPGEPDPGPYPEYVYGSAYGPITSGLVRVFDKTLDARTFLYTRGESRNVVPGKPPVPPGVPAFLRGDAFRVEPVDLPPEAAYPGLLEFVRKDEADKRRAALSEAEAELGRSEALASTAERARDEAETRWRESAVFPAFATGEPSPPAFGEPVGPPPAEVVQARDALEAARLTLRVDEAAVVAARSELAALEARIRADDVKHGRTAGDADSSGRDASRAERRAAADAAAVALARAERELAAARRKARDDAQAQPEVARAEPARDAARQARDAARAALADESPDYTPLSPSFPSKSTGRRTALARWITDRGNPLTARVAANHIWRWHFGRALVETTADFGRNGKPPTHPELLDWLSVELMEPSTPGAEPWSMKHLHRLIVTSRAYRARSHTPDPSHPGRTLDPEDRLYWHFPPSRMEAEVVRDSLLHVAGVLDPTVGGPDIDHAQGLTVRRRSLYFTHHGEATMPFLELFNAPDPCDAYRRTTSVVPQQALALVNSELAVSLGRDLADRLWGPISTDPATAADAPAAFVAAAFEQVLSRPPTPRELELSTAFLARQSTLFQAAGAAVDPARRAREDFIQALFNHNDFLAIH